MSGAVLTMPRLGETMERGEIVGWLVDVGDSFARGDPLIEFYRPLPPLAYLPLVIIWCGIGELSKVLLIYLAIFAPVARTRATRAFSMTLPVASPPACSTRG